MSASKFFGLGVWAPITKLLPLIDPHLALRAGWLARVVAAVEALRQDALKPVSFQR